MKANFRFIYHDKSFIAFDVFNFYLKYLTRLYFTSSEGVLIAISWLKALK